MIIIDDNNSDLLSNGCVATVGFFDGVHTGHRFLIDELKAIATYQNLPAVVVTFSKHPRKILHSDFQPLLLNTLDEKIEQLATTGIDACVLLDFNTDMAQLSAFEFLQQVLLTKYSVHTLVVGHDHRFGHNRSESFADYVRHGNALGIKLIEAQQHTLSESHRVSSSEVRNALLQGDILLAKSILGYNYSFRGIVVNGFQVGRKIGFPTANIQPEEVDKLIPASGVYAVRVKFESGLFRGMMNIGFRPTIENGSERSIEVHIFDFDREIYNSSVEIIFLRKIRDEKKFADMDELVTQLNRDKLEVLKDLSLR